MLEPYAIVTARNVVASMWKEQDRHRRNRHRVADMSTAEAPDQDLLKREEGDAVSAALARLSERERQTLLAHEVSGQDTRSLGEDLGMTAGAVAAQLNRSRARLRVEYLLALQDAEPPTDSCRPVLFALSVGDRRRQREVDAARHLLECNLCAELSLPLMGRRQRSEDEAHVPIRTDADIVLARKSARELAGRLEFSSTDQTLIATAVSEIARNIVQVRGQWGGVHRTGEGTQVRVESRGARHRAGDRRRATRTGRRLQHVRRPGTRSTGCSTTDGRVLGGLRSPARHHRDYDKVAI